MTQQPSSYGESDGVVQYRHEWMTYRKTQKTLRGSNYQRSPIVTLHLPADQVKVLRRSRRVYDMHVDSTSGFSVVEFARVVGQLNERKLAKTIDELTCTAPVTSARYALMNVQVQRHLVRGAAEQRDRFASSISLKTRSA